MKKILLKLLLVSFVLFGSNYFVYADEKIILPQKKPAINKAQEGKNLVNNIIPLKKPSLKTEEIKTKKTRKYNKKTESKSKELISVKKEPEFTEKNSYRNFSSFSFCAIERSEISLPFPANFCITNCLALFIPFFKAAS